MSATALYRLYGADGELLYVGITVDLHQRMEQHSGARWWPEVTKKTAAWYQTYKEADRAETLAIAAERPRYNTGKAYKPRPAEPFETGLEKVERRSLPSAASVPLYRQTAADLNRRIAGGGYKPGERLPSKINVAAMYGISTMTATKCYDLMVRHGVALVVLGNGTFAVSRRICPCFDLRRCDEDCSAATREAVAGELRQMHRDMASRGELSEAETAALDAGVDRIEKHLGI